MVALSDYDDLVRTAVDEGADIAGFMRLGAQGGQMATRFVATDECDVSIKFKDSYLRCTKSDLVIIDSPVGLLGRAIRNEFLAGVSAGVKKPFECPWKCPKTCDYRTSTALRVP